MHLAINKEFTSIRLLLIMMIRLFLRIQEKMKCILDKIRFNVFSMFKNSYFWEGPLKN